MHFAGIDIGSLATKICVISDGEEVEGYLIRRTTANVVKVAQEAYEDCLRELGLKDEDIAYSVVTGYGRNLAVATLADEKVTEITCHSLGAKKLFPNCHTVIDVGGQDSKAMRLDDSGKVVKFAMNDKCAAGTGRFLEVMAAVLGMEMDEMVEAAFKSRKKISITSTCTVFAESEVISLIASGKKAEDIVAGLNEAIAKRLSGLVRQVGIEDEVVMTGGVAKNRGVVKALEHELKHEVRVPEEPQIVGALGAALIALEKFSSHYN
jgi:predicted CoA-substrate-specific enzyme activase